MSDFWAHISSPLSVSSPQKSLLKSQLEAKKAEKTFLENFPVLHSSSLCNCTTALHKVQTEVFILNMFTVTYFNIILAVSNVRTKIYVDLLKVIRTHKASIIQYFSIFQNFDVQIECHLLNSNLIKRNKTSSEESPKIGSHFKKGLF